MSEIKEQKNIDTTTIIKKIGKCRLDFSYLYKLKYMDPVSLWSSHARVVRSEILH